jgi:CBS domain-containing protein
MSVGRICVREVDLAESGESVHVAAKRMHARNVGTLVVVNERQEPIGILTDRDLALRVVGAAKDPCTTVVSEVMTGHPATLPEDAPIESALTAMREGPRRRLLVVDGDNKLVGLLSLDDVLELLSEEFGQIGELLRRESPARLAQI